MWLDQLTAAKSYKLMAIKLQHFTPIASFPVYPNSKKAISHQLTAVGLQLPHAIGGKSAGVTPDPIPNSEVKPRCAEGTAGATRWESTSPPVHS